MEVLAIRYVSFGDLVDIMITTVSNTEMFAWNFCRGYMYLFLYNT